MLGGALFLWFAILQLPFVPKSVPYCEKDQSGKEECATYNVTMYALAKSGRFFDDHNGSIVALATIILAVFTWRLWVSTEKLWASAEKERQANEVKRAVDNIKAADQLTVAKKSADVASWALKTLERPHLFIKISDGIYFDEYENAIVKIILANHGRFPADIIRCLTSVNQIGPHEFGIENEQFWRVIGPSEATEPIPFIVAEGVNIIRIIDEDTGDFVRAIPERSESCNTFCCVDIIYRGAEKNEFRTRYLWIWDHLASTWSLRQKLRT